MEIAIGLPATIPGTTGEQFVEWARKADPPWQMSGRSTNWPKV